MNLTYHKQTTADGYVRKTTTCSLACLRGGSGGTQAPPRCFVMKCFIEISNNSN